MAETTRRRSHLRHLDRGMVLMVMLFISAICHPLLGRVLSDFNPRFALIAPTVFISLLACLVCPHQAMPGAVVFVMLFFESQLTELRGDPFGPSIVENILRGNLYLLSVPISAICFGHAVVLARKERPLWQWRAKSNLRILLRRPSTFLRIYRWPLRLLVAGATADTITTMAFMYHSGTESEMHPAMRMMAEELGIDWGVPLATVVRLVFVVFIAAFWRRWCGLILMLCGAFYCLAALSNHFTWLR